MLQLARRRLGEILPSSIREASLPKPEISQVYNLLWLSPRFVRDKRQEDYDPIPEKTVGNILYIADSNLGVDIKLWVDPERLTPKQAQFLQEMCDSSKGNLSLQNLRDIEEYKSTPLFNESDMSDTWRMNKNSLIWRQVDAAKLLICLQGDYDQVFYSDADITNLRINSGEIQRKLKKHGMVIGVPSILKKGEFENQAFGFSSRKIEFFRELYTRTLQSVTNRLETDMFLEFKNGWNVFLAMTAPLKRGITFFTENDGSSASHPGEHDGFNRKRLL